MQIPSVGWMIIIVVSACLFAAGNIMYPRIKEKEEKQAMTIVVEQTLSPELKLNLRTAKIIKEKLNQKPPSITFEHLDTAAWLIISKGDWLLGLEAKKRENYIKAYVFISEVNEIYDKIRDSYIGISSALSGISETRNQMIIKLNQTLDMLITLLNTLTESK